MGSGCTVYSVAYDTPTPGYGVINANLLRLWKAEARFGRFSSDRTIFGSTPRTSGGFSRCTSRPESW
jgi:hypothetical protein